jgi:hypothetical protein
MSARARPVRQRRDRRNYLVRGYALDTIQNRCHLITVDGAYRRIHVQIRGTR